MYFNRAIDSRSHPVTSRIADSVWRRYFWDKISHDILSAMQVPLSSLRYPNIKQLTDLDKYRWWLALSYADPLPYDDELLQLAEKLVLSEQDVFTLAVQAGRLSLVKSIIDRKSQKNHEVVDWILADQADVIYSAVEAGDLNMFEALLNCLSSEAISSVMTSSHFRAFRLAAKKGHFSVVKKIIEGLPEQAIKMICAQNYEALSESAIHGHLDVFEYLEGILEDQALSIVQSIVGRIFLLAAENGCLTVINGLIERFPQEVPDLIRSNQYRAVRLAAAQGQVGVVERLIDYLPNESAEMIKANDHHVVLEAARYGHLDVIEAVVKRCSKEDCLPIWKAFQNAVIGDHKDLTDYFLGFPEVYNQAKQQAERFKSYIQHFEQQQLQLPAVESRLRYGVYSIKKNPSVNSGSTEQGISVTSF